MGRDAVIVTHELRHSFAGPGGKPVIAIDGVSLAVPSRRLTALVGPDGAGKTTFMRMVAGLMKPDAGLLRVLEVDVAKNPQWVQNRISYMPQRFGLYVDLTVRENLDLYASLHGVSDEAKDDRLAGILGLTDLARFADRFAGKLSGGMKQKLGIACSLVRSPQLLLLDEPSVGVDPLSRREIWKIISHLQDKEGLSVMINTSFMEEAERCEHVFVLNRGAVLAEGTPNDLRARVRGLTFTALTPQGTTSRELQATLFDAANDILDATPKAGNVNFVQAQDTVEEIIEGIIPGVTISRRAENLEDAFMVLLRDKGLGKMGLQAGAAPSFQVDTYAGARNLNAIVVRDLVKKFGDFTAVASTSFEVASGEIFGLLGPNGAGKTTTFRMLCGLLPATAGFLEVAGHNLRTARAKARSRIGYVSQKFSLYGNLSVRENLEFFAGAYGLAGRFLAKRVKDSLAHFDLDPSIRAVDLTAGFQKRLAVAVGLIHQPDILFLDEPTSGIDPLARRVFWRTMTELAKGGVTIIVTTHFMEEAEYCDRVAIQDGGRMLAIGTPRQIQQQACSGYFSDMNTAFIAIVEKAREGDSAIIKAPP